MKPGTFFGGIRAAVCGLRSEKGQTVIEYALVVALIAVVLFFLLQGAGNEGVKNSGEKINAAFTN